MAQGKKSSGGTNDDRHCKKSNKKHPGVAPGAHNGHSIGGYSIKKHGREAAEARASRSAA